MGKMHTKQIENTIWGKILATNNITAYFLVKERLTGKFHQFRLQDYNFKTKSKFYFEIEMTVWLTVYYDKMT